MVVVPYLAALSAIAGLVLAFYYYKAVEAAPAAPLDPELSRQLEALGYAEEPAGDDVTKPHSSTFDQ